MFVLAVFSAVFGVWRFLDTKIAKVNKTADDAKDALAEYKTHAAETFATKQGLGEFRDEMRQGFRDITVRLDHVIQADHKPMRRS